MRRPTCCGTGPGLPIAKALTELHGGMLNIATAPGEGTIVTLHFPGGTRHPPAGGERGLAVPPRGPRQDGAWRGDGRVF